MDEEFLATLKLITGEEIVSKVCYLEDEDKVLLENPLQVELAKQRKGQLEVSGFSFKEWVSATFDTMFILKRDHIITMTEVDGQIQEFYEKTLQRLENGKSLTGRANKLPRGSGYLGSVKEMKKTLEDLFNRS
jgi:hypothetical protein|tara:strand:- start:835 stop:1233 length:399 start_codon:yes stop_codon:yes gene_type:complete